MSGSSAEAHAAASWPPWPERPPEGVMGSETSAGAAKRRRMVGRHARRRKSEALGRATRRAVRRARSRRRGFCRPIR